MKVVSTIDYGSCIYVFVKSEDGYGFGFDGTKSSLIARFVSLPVNKGWSVPAGYGEKAEELAKAAIVAAFAKQTVEV